MRSEFSDQCLALVLWMDFSEVIAGLDQFEFQRAEFQTLKPYFGWTHSVYPLVRRIAATDAATEGSSRSSSPALSIPAA
jgi:hypothetical protein